MPYNQPVERAASILLFFFFLGLLLAGFLGGARSPRTRGILLWLCLALVNLGALAVLFAVYAVSRLDGSTPPGLVDILRPLAIPLVLIALVDAAVVGIYRRGSR
jgi:peptidoglycan/LPS O-acetylase OafA/YrhL